MQIQKGKSTRRELSTFTVTCENMKLVLGLFKVKHNGSQNCCFISYLHYIVSYIVCSTRFEVFQYSKRKNIRKIKEQIKKPIKFGQILSQSIVLRKGALPLNTPAVEGQGGGGGRGTYTARPRRPKCTQLASLALDSLCLP